MQYSTLEIMAAGSLENVRDLCVDVESCLSFGIIGELANTLLARLCALPAAPTVS